MPQNCVLVELKWPRAGQAYLIILFLLACKVENQPIELYIVEPLSLCLQA